MLTVYCGASFSSFPDLFTYMKLMKAQVGVKKNCAIYQFNNFVAEIGTMPDIIIIIILVSLQSYPQQTNSGQFNLRIDGQYH